MFVSPPARFAPAVPRLAVLRVAARAEPLDVELSGDAPSWCAPIRISPDGGRVVFLRAPSPRSPQRPDRRRRDRHATPPDTECGLLVDVAPDGSRVLMTAREPGSLTEIFSAPFAGGEVTKLNQTLAPGVSAFPGPITPDGTRVVYGTRTDCVVLPPSDVSCPVELFVAPLEGGASTPLDLPDLPLDGPRDLSEVFSVSPDGETGVSAMFERLPEDVNEDRSGRPLQYAARGRPGDVLHEGGWLSEPSVHQRRPARRLRPGRGAAQRERLRWPRGEAQSRPRRYLGPPWTSPSRRMARAWSTGRTRSGASTSSTACPRSAG